jgi:erythromycin esterase-like protein
MIRRALLFLLPAVALAQPAYVDLGFEVAARGQFWDWPSSSNTQYQFAPDTTVFQSGAQSMRIRSLPAATSSSLGVTSILLPLELVRGHHVQITGWMKTDSVVGYAAVWFRVDGPSGTLSLDNMSSIGPRGTTDWKQYTIDRDVSPNAATIIFGVFLSGTGTAWYDTLGITIDGKPYDPGPAPAIGEPTAPQLDWVKKTAIPLAGDDPGLPLDDLAGLRDLIGDAHVVALGEDTHGTREFFRTKHRILEYLATELGFSVFAIEANMPESYAMNDYVLNGVGDPKEFLKGMYFWTWNTQEVLDMVEWMRAFNLSGKGPIQFTGFDMQTPDVAEKIVQSFVANADPDYADQLSNVYAGLKNAGKPTSDFGMVTRSFLLAPVAGKKVHYTGWIKTQDLTAGYAGLWWSVWDVNGKFIAGDNMSNRGVTGTTDWKQYSIDVDMPANAVSITYGALHAGTGSAWFDSPAVSADGVVLDTFGFPGFVLRDAQGLSNFDVVIDPSVLHNGSATVRSTYIGPTLLTKTAAAAQTAATVDYLQSSRDAYVANGAAPVDVDWAIQNARVVAQYADLQARPTANVRDPAMAANAQWILSQQPEGSKMVIWAHNGHVARSPGAMGSYLGQQYGDDYRVLGFAFHDGQYNAVGPQGLIPYNAVPSFPGSAEYIMHKAEIAPFVLDLRNASLDDGGSSWLKTQIMSRSIGAVPVDGFFVTTTLTRNYDALIFFEHSNPSTLLPF